MKKEHYTRPEAVVVGMETESDILQGSHEEESDMTLSMENGLGGEGVTHENPTEILGKENNIDVWDTNGDTQSDLTTTTTQKAMKTTATIFSSL